MEATFKLVPWEPRVAAKCSALELRVSGLRGMTAPTGVVNGAHGFFAVYKNKPFAVFLSAASGVAVLIDEEIWPLTPDVTMSWHPPSATNYQRAFKIKTADRSAILKYGRGPWYKPWQMIIETIAPDEWWGLTCDLPSWVEAGWSAGDLGKRLDEHLKHVQGR